MGQDEPNTFDESQSANQISHFFDLPEAKSTFRSKAASCRELLKEIKSLTYTTYDKEAMSDLYDMEWTWAKFPEEYKSSPYPGQICVVQLMRNGSRRAKHL